MHLDELDQPGAVLVRHPVVGLDQPAGLHVLEELLRPRVHASRPPYRTVVSIESIATRRSELTRQAARLFAAEGLPRHVDGRPRRGDGRAEGLALLAHRLEAGAPLRDDARGRGRVPRRARRAARGRAAAVERIRLALRAHLRVVAEQLDMATVFIREWRYLEGERREEIVAERRRYEERLRALFREGREHGELRTDLDERRRGAARALGGELGLHLADARPRHGRAGRLASPRSSSTACAATRRVRDDDAPDRQSVREPGHARARAEVALAARCGRDRLATERAGPRYRARPGARRPTRSSSSPATGASTRCSTAHGRDGLGFVPGGGTSVLPRALGLPRDPLAAARPIAAGRTRRISLGRANGRRFGFAAGVGLDAELIRRMDARGRDENGKRPGDLTFAWTALRHAGGAPGPLRPGARGRRPRTAAFALVANCDPYTYVGKLPLRRLAAREFDGGLDLRRSPAAAGASLPGAVRYLLTGRTGLPLAPLHDADRIEVRCDAPMPLQARRRGSRRRRPRSSSRRSATRSVLVVRCGLVRREPRHR